MLQQDYPERGVRELVQDLYRDFQRMVAQTIELAKAEMSVKTSKLAKDGVALAVGGVLAFSGFLFLLTAATAALALVLPFWAAALIVGGVVCLIGGIMAASGYSKMKKVDLTPERTVQSLKEDREWLKSQMS